jgi:hypothetical protein
MLDWPAGVPPGPERFLFPRLLPIRVSGPCRVKDPGKARPAQPAPQASLTRRAAIR